MYIGKVDPPAQHTLAQVKFLAVFQDIHLFYIEPRSILNAKGNGQPVGHIDHAFILDSFPGDIGLEAVETAGDIGSRIMDAIGD